MKRYLGKAEIKQLTDYIDQQLPKESRPLIKNIVQSLSPNILYLPIEDIKKQYRDFMWGQMWKTREDLKNKILMYRHRNASAFDKEQEDIFKGFINENYRLEYQYLNSGTFNPSFIQQWFDSFTKVNIVDELSIGEIINADDIRDYIEKKYGKQYADKDSLKLTEKIKANLDNFYCGVDYDYFFKATLIYLKSKDERILNNVLHSNNDDFMRIQ